jgi:MFS family permease
MKPQRRLHMPKLLRQREFRLFWVGQTVSLVGDQISALAIPLVGVLVLHADAAQMGYLTAVGLAPSLLFSLYAGVRLDRRGRRRRAMLWADIGRASLLITIPIAWWSHVLHLGQLYAVAFLGGTLDVIFFVAYSTLFVALTPPEDFVQGQSLINGSRAASQLGGQSLAGLLIAALTAPVALLVDATSFVASAISLSRIKPAEPPPAAEQRGALMAGVRFIAGSPVVRRGLGATATVNYFNFVFFALFVLFAVRGLGVTPATLGIILGVAGAGAIAGSLLTGPVSRRIGIGPAFALSCVVFPAPLLLVPAAPAHSSWTALFLFMSELLSGFGVMLLDITVGSIFAAVIPHELRARVSGAYRTVNYGVRPLGALTGGALGSTIGLRPTLWIAAAGGISCVLWTLSPAILKLRTLDGPQPEPTLDDPASTLTSVAG